MPIVLVLTAVYYLLRGIISSSNIEECLVSGFANFMSLIILFCITYMLNDIFNFLGYVGRHGGNMDSRMIRKGVTVHLPVQVEGALLAIGDLHATMGDGEVAGTGLEVAGAVTIRVRLIKQFELHWPVTETVDAYYVNSCGGTCDIALREGYHEMHRLIQHAYNMDSTDAALYMSVQGYAEANQACLVDEGGGNTFRIGTPKVPYKKRLIPKA